MARRIPVDVLAWFERGSLLRDVVCGAAAGALGVFAMNQATAGLSKLESRRKGGASKQPEREPSTEKLARKVAAPVGVKLEGKRKKTAGNVVHWGYGTLWGAAYGAMHGRVPYAGRLFGLGFGLGLFLAGDEIMVPALRLAPPPHQVPLSQHLSALAAHLVYGSAAESSFRLTRRLLA